MAELRTPEVEDLLKVFAGLDDPDDIFALLEDLFTVREIKDTSQRLDVARMLKKGSSYAVIEQATGASATTIARVSKALNYGAGGYQRAFEVLGDSAGEGAQADAPDTDPNTTPGATSNAAPGTEPGTTPNAAPGTPGATPAKTEAAHEA